MSSLNHKHPLISRRSFVKYAGLGAIPLGLYQLLPSTLAAEVKEKNKEERNKEIVLEKHYLLFPILNGEKKAQIDLAIDGKNIREFDAEIAPNKDNVSFWAFLDISAFRGRKATITARGATEEGIRMVIQSNTIPGQEKFYNESLRPQFHFTQKVGWSNDPNGLVFADGQWHLYFQHNPYGRQWGNMHWGHAVSKDLIHWEQLPIAIYSKRRGDLAFSGSASVDKKNTSGWKTGKNELIIASWTSTGRGECIAYSNDQGRTFTEFEGNPVIRHKGRDPKIIWYEPGNHWVMAVFDEDDQPGMPGQGIAFYTSKNLKQWTFQSKLMGYYECPEIFELPVDGNRNYTKWVVFAADAQYAIGSFDGKIFTPEHEGKHQVHYGSYYASQTFSNAPDGRRIQIGWAKIDMEDMPFNQMMTFPHQLTLRTTPNGIRMFAKPIREIEKLHKKKHSIKNKILTEDVSVKLPVSGRLFDIRAEFLVNKASATGIKLGDANIVFNGKELCRAPLEPIDRKIQIQILLDRSSIEVCGNDGRVYITQSFRSKEEIGTIEAFCAGGQAKLIRLEAYELDSIWNI